MKRITALAAMVGFSASAASLGAQGPSSAVVDERLAQLANPMRVLTVAAHPDDEDTGLITWLVRGQHVNTAYLSLTRGDGGQNLIGNELGEALGVIRTEELLAARRIDGAHQYFTRAYDFGFSKTATETFSHWPKDSLLGDVVTVVRAFRPQVMIAFFAGTPRDGHGQHQASAILAREAYESAAEDTVRFPAAKYGAPWRVLKFYRTGRQEPAAATLTINVGEYNPVLGESYAEIAAESRSQHKSQGFGTLKRKGVVKSYLIRVDSRVPAPADTKAEKSIFDGIEQSPVTGAAWLAETRALVPIEAVADRQAVAADEAANVKVTVFNRSRKPVRVSQSAGALGAVVLPDSSLSWTTTYSSQVLTQPWWLAQPRTGDLFTPQIDSRSEDMRAADESPSVTVRISEYVANPLTVPPRDRHEFEARIIDVPAPIVSHYADPVRGDVQRPLMVAPGVSVTLDRSVEVARAGAALDRFIGVTLRSALRDTTAVVVRLNLPSGLVADSAARTRTMSIGSTSRVTFRVRGSLPGGRYKIGVVATAKGSTYSSGYVPVKYDHITPRTMYRPATLTLNAIHFTLPKNLTVAYVPGVGDNVEPMLEEMGAPVSVVDPDQIAMTDLSRFTTVVVGPRAYQASQILRDNNPYLLDYVKKGGRLVVQYGQYELMRAGMMPYPVTIRNPHDRVTDENAPVRILDSASPLLNVPNKITQRDFDDWVQERALYMPFTFDSHYQAILAMNDPGENVRAAGDLESLRNPAMNTVEPGTAAPNLGGVLIANYGKGSYIYVSLALFRQLPAGVSGGVRIFANLLAGK